MKKVLFSLLFICLGIYSLNAQNYNGYSAPFIPIVGSEPSGGSDILPDRNMSSWIESRYSFNIQDLNICLQRDLEKKRIYRRTFYFLTGFQYYITLVGTTQSDIFLVGNPYSNEIKYYNLGQKEGGYMYNIAVEKSPWHVQVEVRYPVEAVGSGYISVRQFGYAE